MAINFVQSRHLASGTIAYNSNNTLGNLLIVVAMDQSSSAASLGCLDSQGNSYTALPPKSSSSGNWTAQAFFCRSAKAGANTVSLTSSSLLTWGAIHEFSGVNTFDVGAIATGTGNAQDSGPVVTSVAAELLFGFEFANTDLGQNTVTPGAGWTQAEAEPAAFLTQYQIVAATGTYNSTSTTTSGKSGAVNWMQQIATFFSGPAPTNKAFTFAWGHGF